MSNPIVLAYLEALPGVVVQRDPYHPVTRVTREGRTLTLRNRDLGACRSPADLEALLLQHTPKEAPVPTIPSPYFAHVLQFFKYDHLPEYLQEVSKPFADLANLVAEQSSNPETTVALRKLLEAKDAAVRAVLVKT